MWMKKSTLTHPHQCIQSTERTQYDLVLMKWSVYEWTKLQTHTSTTTQMWPEFSKYLFTFDCLFSKHKRLESCIESPEPHTHPRPFPFPREIIARNFMLSFIRLRIHSLENVCKYNPILAFGFAWFIQALWLYFVRYFQASCLRFSPEPPPSSECISNTIWNESPKYIGCWFESVFFCKMTMWVTLY